MHNRPDKKEEIKHNLQIGRDENGFNYYLIVGGVRIELDEIEMQLLGSKIDELLYND